MLLLNSKAEKAVSSFVKEATVLELSSCPMFAEKYMMTMLLREIE